MSLITFSALQDGVTSVAAAPTNNALNTIYNDYNGNITDANVSSSAAIGFAKISGGSATALTAWASWVPSWTNLTSTSGTLSYAKYVQIGKTVHFRLKFIFGASSSISGAVAVSVPVNFSGDYATNDQLNVSVQMDDASGNRYLGSAVVTSSSTMTILSVAAGSASAFFENTSSSAPFTWTTTDTIFITGTYESV